MITDKVVLGMSDPEARRRRVRVQQAVTGAGANDQVLFDQIVCLSRILNEHSVAHGGVRHVTLEAQVMHSMQSERTIEGAVHGKTASKRLVYIADHVVVYRIATKLECLTHQRQLDVTEATDEGIVTW